MIQELVSQNTIQNFALSLNSCRWRGLDQNFWLNMFFKDCPGRVANPGSFLFLFIFSITSSALDRSPIAPSYHLAKHGISIDELLVKIKMQRGFRRFLSAILKRSVVRLSLDLQHLTMLRTKSQNF